MRDFVKSTRSAVDIAGLILPLALRFDWATIRRLSRVNSLFSASRIIDNFSDMKSMFFHKDLPVASPDPTPLPEKPQDLPLEFSFQGETYCVADWLAARRVTAMVVLKRGAVAHEQYSLGTSVSDRRISWSMAKSILSAAFGVAVNDGLIASIDAPVSDYVPALENSAYAGVTIKNVLNMASGVRFDENYLDFHSDINRMGRVLALGRSMDGFAAGLTQRARKPGFERQYVSIDTHVLGMVLRAATNRTLASYLSEKILTPLRLEGDVYYLTDGDGTEFALGGLNMRTRDFARFGLMMANGGALDGRQIVPADWVRASTANLAPKPCGEDRVTDRGLLGYGYQWWLPPQAASGEFFAIGIYGQYIYVDSAAQVVIAVNGADLEFTQGDGRITLANMALFRAIAQGLR